MGQVNVSLPTDGTTADVADYNTPITTIVNEINGNLDNSNIASDAAIAGSKLADGSVTSAKLAEAFFKGRHQANTTNSQVSGLTEQFGWGFIQGDATSKIEKTVTFPTAFGSAPLTVLATPIGSHTSSPTAITDFTTDPATVVVATPNDITASSFQVHLLTHTSTFGNTAYFGFTWRAIGAV